MTTMTLEIHAGRDPRQGRRPGSTVRLTRRGRVVVFVLALLALTVLGMVGASVAGAAGRGDALRTHTVTVAPGMTLWDLAATAAHGGDIEAMEQEISQINGLSGGLLITGQSLRIPS